MFNNDKRPAFTMAEIIIAMGIIGVVAAITVPQILGNTSGRANRLMIQKSYTVLSQALKVAQAKLDYNMSDVEKIVNKTGTGAEDLNLQLSVENLLTKTMDMKKLDKTTHAFTGKLLTLSATDTTDGDATLSRASSETTTGITVDNSGAGDKRGAIFESREGVYYIFPDKTDIDSYSCTKSSPCLAYIDVNGPDSPNTLVTCSTESNTGYWYWDYVVDATSGNVTTDKTKYMKNSTTEAPACEIDPMKVKDVYPVIIYGSTVVPALNAVESILTSN